MAGIVAYLYLLVRFTDLHPSLLPHVWAVYYFSFLICVWIHELGHLVAGWAVGMRMSEMHVGGFRMSLGGVLRMRWADARPGVGGLVSGSFKNERHAALRSLVFAAGGPVVSIFGGAVLWTYLDAYSVPGQTSGFHSVWLALWQSTALLSFLLGWMNLVPMNLDGLRSDGGAMLDLLSVKEQDVDRWNALAYVRSRIADGARPRDMPDELLERVRQEAKTNAETDGTVAYYALVTAMDRGDWPRVSVLRDAALQLPVIIDPTFVASAWTAAVQEKDTAQAREYLRRVQGGRDYSVDLVEAAIHAVEGDLPQARRLLGTATERFHRREALIGGGWVQFTEELMDWVAKQCEMSSLPQPSLEEPTWRKALRQVESVARPREYPADQIAAGLADSRVQDRERAWLLWLAFQRAADGADPESAGNQLQPLMDLLPAADERLRARVLCAAVYFHGVHSRDAVHARKCVDRLPSGVPPGDEYWLVRAQGALALVEGRWDEAESTRQRAASALRQCLPPAVLGGPWAAAFSESLHRLAPPPDLSPTS